MRSKIKVLLIVVGVIMVIPVYLTVDIFLHRNENYLEYGYDPNLLGMIGSTPEEQGHDVWADVVEVFPLGERIHSYYTYSRKGYKYHGIKPIKRITDQAELSQLRNHLSRLRQYEEYVPIDLKEQAIEGYDVFSNSLQE